jgi:hypothetical protein
MCAKCAKSSSRTFSAFTATAERNTKQLRKCSAHVARFCHRKLKFISTKSFTSRKKFTRKSLSTIRHRIYSMKTGSVRYQSLNLPTITLLNIPALFLFWIIPLLNFSCLSRTSKHFAPILESFTGKTFFICIFIDVENVIFSASSTNFSCWLPKAKNVQIRA